MSTASGPAPSGRRGRRAGYAVAAVMLLLGPFTALTAVVVMTAPGVFFLDADVAFALHRLVLDHPALASGLRLVGVITLPNCLRLIAVVSALLLWRRGRGRAAGWLLLTMTIGGVLGGVLKQVFSRSRPEWPDAITVLSGYSFPSGHALNSMLAAGCAMVLLEPGLSPAGRRRLRVTLAGFVLLVGFDRVGLGVHYLTDVLAGWSLALAVLFATLAAFGPLSPPSPAAPPRSADAPGDSVSDHAQAADRPPHAVPTDPGPARGGDRRSG